MFVSKSVKLIQEWFGFRVVDKDGLDFDPFLLDVAYLESAE